MLKLMQNIRVVSSLLILIVLVAFSSCKKEVATKTGPSQGARKVLPIQVEAFIVRTKSLSENLEVPGTLLPFEETEIRPEISGRLVKMNIQEGGIVQTGELLGKIFDDDLQAQLKKLEVQLKIAEKTLERQQELLKIQGISQQEVDLSELQVNNIKADMELVQVSISKTEIRAPYAGKLGLRNVSLGAYVSPANVLTTIRQLIRLKLDFTVPEKYGGIFRKGKNVQFTIAGSNQVFSANVLATDTEIAAETRSLKVRAVVQGNNGTLIPGAYAKVLFSIGGDDRSLIIPTQAVIPEARNKKVIIYRNGQPEFRIVETGIRDAEFVQILSGLAEGDTVVTTGLLSIREGSELRLSKILLKN